MIQELLLPVGGGRAVAVALLGLFVLAAFWYDLTCHTVKIYNWDGEKYRLLGRERLRKVNDTYVIKLRESRGEASRTTIYLLSASARLVKRRRYESLLFRAGREEVWLPIEERMRAEALYAHR